jgi:hypothetical protein
MLHICVRSTLPWHDEAAVAASLIPGVRPQVELWNTTFDMRYAAFRQRLVEIARQNLARVEGARVSALDDVPRGALVVPVDDDDWFSPELAERLLSEPGEGLQGYHWNRYIVETPRRAHRWPWPDRRRAADTSRHTCGSNNYAVRNLPEHTESIASHVRASALFDASPGRFRHVSASLSVQNRNLASRSALAAGSSTLTRGELIERFGRHRKLYARLRLPPEVAWAQPCIASMAELMHAVRLK